MAGSISIHCVASVPSHSALFSISNYFSHLFRPFSVMQGLNLVSTWVKVPHLGGIHPVSISKLKLPPPCASQQFPAFIHLVSTILPLRPLNSFLHAFSCGFNVASQQLPAFMRFQASTALILFRCLTSPLHLPLSHQFSALIWLQYIHVPPFSQHLLTWILSQYLNSPHPAPGPKKHVQVKKKKYQGPKTSSPMWAQAHITMEFPPPQPYGRKVHKAGAGVQKAETEVRNN